MDLGGKVVVIIGGLGLIGRSLAAGLAAAGASVVVASRSAGAPEALSVFGHLDGTVRDRIGAAAVDIGDPASIESMLAEVARRHGSIDTVINSALPRHDRVARRIEDVRIEDFRDYVTGHLGGFFLLAQKACAFFGEQGHGHLIQLGSVYGTMNPRFEIYDDTPMTKEFGYVASKAAIIQLTGYLAKYYQGRNIRVNCVSPGGIFDHQHPTFVERYNAHCSSKGILEPDDLVGIFAFLVSDAAIHVNGRNIVVDDGFSL